MISSINLKQVSSSNKAEDTLPSGWERHEDSEGAYYWHVKSGTIQRERPPHTQDGDDTDVVPSVWPDELSDGENGEEERQEKP